MTDKPTLTVPGYEAGKDVAELFSRMNRLLVYGNAGGGTACLLMAAAMMQAGAYTAWIVLPLTFFWFGIVFAFWTLATLYGIAVGRVAEQNVILGMIMKRRYKLPIVGWEFALSDHQHKAGITTGPALIVSGMCFILGSISGFGLLLFV